MDPTEAAKTVTVAEALEAAVAHHRAGRLAAAREFYRAILEVQPKNFNALHLLGALSRRQGDAAAAVRLITEALAIDGSFAPAYANLSGALLDHGRIDEAVKAGRTALTLNPGELEAGRSLLRCLLYLPGLDPEQRLAAHRDFAARHQPPPERALPPPANDRTPERRLRVGLLSSDLWSHPVGRNLLPLLRHRDRAASELIAYAEFEKPDAVHAEIRELCDGWRSTADLDDRAVAELIRRDGIDILVVLAARFDQNRPLVACYRPAPVQVSMFDGATTALRGIDYWITDPVLTPPGTTERFVETLAALPVLLAYQGLDEAPPVSALPAATAAAAAVTFGSFNNPTKISDVAIALWARVLRATPGSRLLLKYRASYGDPELCGRLRVAFGAEGVDPTRLRFLSLDEDRSTHLTAYGAVDIALDTTPFSGATTTFEALWMGVPTITLAGDTMISRMSASHLTAVGLSELIAPSADAFVERAVALAGDPARLARLRADLRDLVARSPLCDGPAYARSVESLWRLLWRRWCAAPGAGL
jgi:protein O-GlcNAc transferase